MGVQPNISVVIVSYNVKELVLTCLRTLYAFLPKDLSIETILVDNQSKDQTVEAVKEQFPQVKIIANAFNAGFPHANNQAFDIATGDYIMMLNPDTEFLDESLFQLYQRIHQDKSLSLIAPNT